VIGPETGYQAHMTDAWHGNNEHQEGVMSSGRCDGTGGSHQLHFVDRVPSLSPEVGGE
jgi:hypothetical protein